MSSKLRGEDFVEEGFYDKLISETEAATKSVKGLVALLKSDLKASKGSLSNPKTISGLKQFNSEVSSIRTNIGNLNKLEKETIRLTNQLAESKSKRAKVNAVLNDKLKEQRKLNRENAKELTQTSNAYKRLSAEVNKAQARFKRLAAEHGINSRQAKKAAIAFDLVDKRLASINARARDGRRDVGRYSLALGKLRGSLMQVGQAAGLSFGVFGAARLFGSTVGVIKDYEDALVTLEGVLRQSREELAPLEAKIREVGATSVRSATETAQLAESLATLGESPESIEKLLLAATNLSIGLKAPSDEAGAFLVQMLNAFGASRDEADKYAETIGKIRTSTSLDFQKMRDSFQYLAPISKALGEDLAHTGAMIGILADNGIKAERAGRLMSTGQQKLAGSGMSLAEALDLINQKANSGASELELMSTASKLLGRQTAGLGIILAYNTEKLKLSAEAIRNSEGALDDLVNSQLKSLSSELKLLNSAWEEYIIKNDEVNKIGDKIKTVLRYVKTHISELIGVISLVIKGWLLYNVVTKGYIFYTKLAAIQSTIMQKRLLLQRSAAIAAAGGTTKLTWATMMFNRAMMSNVIGIVITLLGTLLLSMDAFGLSTKDAAFQMEEFNDKQESSRRIADKVSESVGAEIYKLELLTDRLKRTTHQSKERKKILDEIHKEHGVTISDLKDEAKFANEVATAYAKVVAQLEQKALSRAREDELTSLITQSEKIKSRIEELGFSHWTAFGIGLTPEQENKVDKDNRKTKQQIDEANKLFDELNKIEALKAKLKSDMAFDFNLNGGGDLGADSETDKGKGTTASVGSTSLKKTPSEIQLEKEKVALEKQKAIIEYKLSLVKDGTEEEISLLIDLANKNDELSEHDAKMDVVRLKAKKDAIEKQLSTVKKGSKAEAKLQEKLLVAKQKVSEAEAELDTKSIERATTFNNEMERIKQKTQSMEDEAAKERIAKKEKEAEELLKIEKENAKQIADSRKALAKVLNTASESAAKYLINRSNERIDALDREVEATQDRANTFRLIAAQGNLDAKESIAVEEKAQADATLQKEKELRKQKTIELSLAMIKTYTATLEATDDPAKALTSVLKNGTLLATIVKSLPSFDVGTENTSKHINGGNGGVDGKGGFLAINHPNEKIFNSKDSSMIGFDVPNSVVAETFAKVRRGDYTKRTTDGAIAISGGNAIMVEEIRELNKSIKELDIPHYSTTFDDTTGTIKEIIKFKNRTERKERRANLW